MVASSFPTEARSVRSYHSDLWQMSWGETDAIAAVKEEMANAAQQKHQQQAQDPAQEVNMPGFQLQGFQQAGFIMTTVPGTQCLVPAMLFSIQAEQQPAAASPTSAQQPQARTQGQHSKSISAAPTPSKAALVEVQQTMTQADFEASGEELPSIGSEGHFDGSCKRCAFFPKGRCTNGKDCSHCHFAHEPRSRLRKRNATKAQRGASQDEIVLEDDACRTVFEQHSCNPSASEDTQLVVADTNTRQPEDVMKTFNSALQALLQAYSDDEDKEADVSTLDSPTMCADSDHEDMSAMSCNGSDDPSLSASTISMKGALSETSDSETASVQAVEHEDTTSPQSASTPTSWFSMQRSRKAEKSATVDIGRMTRALLNKLTEQRFESLCGQILALPVSTPEELAVVVAEIFQKATTQDAFRNLYTELCMRLDAHFRPQDGMIGGKSFRSALVNECQATFERNLKPADAAVFAGLNAEETFEVEMVLKTRRLGNMRFIGDLLVKKLLAPKLLLPIVQELLNGDEAAVESLIALLTVVGPEYEMKQCLYQAALRDAFAVLHGKMSDKAVCARVGCQINDLLDAKARGWKSRSTSC